MLGDPCLGLSLGPREITGDLQLPGGHACMEASCFPSSYGTWGDDAPPTIPSIPEASGRTVLLSWVQPFLV